MSPATPGNKAHAQPLQPVDVLEGLDPVMLLQGKEVQGEMNITVTRGLFRYMFAGRCRRWKGPGFMCGIAGAYWRLN